MSTHSPILDVMPAGTGRAAPMPAEQRRAAIVASVAPLVRQRGRAVTTRQIAHAAGIAEGTIFRVFADKRELIDAVICHELDEAPVLAALAEIGVEESLDSRLLAACDVLQQRMRRVTQMMYLLWTSDGGHAPARRGAPTRRDSGATRAEVIRLLAPDADRLSTSTDRAAALLIGLLWATSRSILDPTGQPVEAADVVDLVLHGIIRPENAS